jgi:hypothetical protein
MDAAYVATRWTPFTCGVPQLTGLFPVWLHGARVRLIMKRADARCIPESVDLSRAVLPSWCSLRDIWTTKGEVGSTWQHFCTVWCCVEVYEHVNNFSENSENEGTTKFH